MRRASVGGSVRIPEEGVDDGASSDKGGTVDAAAVADGGEAVS